MEGLGGIGYIAEQILAGETIKKIALGLGTSVQTVYKFIHMSTEHESAFREARRQAAPWNPSSLVPHGTRSRRLSSNRCLRHRFPIPR